MKQIKFLNNPFSAGIDFIRRLTYINGPRTERITKNLMAETHNIDIQMKRKELIKTPKRIKIKKNPLVSMV